MVACNFAPIEHVSQSRTYAMRKIQRTGYGMAGEIGHRDEAGFKASGWLTRAIFPI